MVFNQLFENLPLCITNSYYPICGFILALSKDAEGQGPLE
jgi:hypothetical protein